MPPARTNVFTSSNAPSPPRIRSNNRLFTFSEIVSAQKTQKQALAQKQRKKNATRIKALQVADKNARKIMNDVIQKQKVFNANEEDAQPWL